MSSTISTLNPEFNSSEIEPPLVTGVDIELAGQTVPNKSLNRRDFLKLSVATTAGVFLGANYVNAQAAPHNEQVYSTLHTLEQESAPMEGYFTPYHTETMWMNLGNRSGTLILNPNRVPADKIAVIKNQILNATSDEQLKLIGGFVYNEAAFNSVSERIKAANVQSVYGGILSLRTILAQLYTDDLGSHKDIFVAPQVLRLGITQANKASGVFRKIIIEQKQVYQNGKLINLPAGERVQEGITLDCKADNNMTFFSDLVRGSEQNFGYKWNPATGYNEINPDGSIGKVIGVPPQMKMVLV